MFEKENRYCTKGVKEKIPLATQLMVWQMIDDLKRMKIQVDYLQIFKLSEVDNAQQIEHSQEVPKYTHTMKIPLVKPIKQKIFVIDDGDHSTMLLAEEY